MEQEWRLALSYLPKHLASVLQQVPEDGVREIRLRREAPLTLSTVCGERYVTEKGELTALRQPALLAVTAEQLEETALSLCGYSLYTHQEELRDGYLTTESGLRVGVGGTVVCAAGAPVSMQAITSLCLRVHRRHAGCSTALCRETVVNGQVLSTLICGPPSSGKTSLLRDLAAQLAQGVEGHRYRVAVVDERSELGYAQALGECDVLRGCPKPEGIRRAVRLLAPDVVLFDEWGTAEESEAVLDALFCGVSVVTSCHAGCYEELAHRVGLSPQVLAAFDRVVELDGKTPGRISRMIKQGDGYAQGNRHLSTDDKLLVAGQSIFRRA